MTDLTIDALTPGINPSGVEPLPTVQLGNDVYLTVTQLAAFATSSVLSANNSWSGTATFTKQITSSYTSLASTPALRFTGAWYSGGNTTSTKPHCLIEPAGTTSSGWSVNGTGLGVNCASGFDGNIVDFQLIGSSVFNISYDGMATFGGNVQIGGTLLTALRVTGTDPISVISGQVVAGGGVIRAGDMAISPAFIVDVAEGTSVGAIRMPAVADHASAISFGDSTFLGYGTSGIFLDSVDTTVAMQFLSDDGLNLRGEVASGSAFTGGSVSDFGVVSYGALKLATAGGTVGLTIDTSQNTILAGRATISGTDPGSAAAGTVAIGAGSVYAEDIVATAGITVGPTANTLDYSATLQVGGVDGINFFTSSPGAGIYAFDGNVTVAADLRQPGGQFHYLRGNSVTDGSVRISSPAASTCAIEARIAGVWTTIGNFA